MKLTFLDESCGTSGKHDSSVAIEGEESRTAQRRLRIPLRYIPSHLVLAVHVRFHYRTTIALLPQGIEESKPGRRNGKCWLESFGLVLFMW